MPSALGQCKYGKTVAWAQQPRFGHAWSGGGWQSVLRCTLRDGLVRPTDKRTEVTSAGVATMPLSSTFTLRSLFRSGVAGDSPIGGSGDLGLVGLAGVVSHGSGGVEDAAALEDDGAHPGSGIDVSSTSLRGCFAALSSSGSRGARLTCPMCSWHPVPFRSRLRIRGSRWWFTVGVGYRWQWCVPNVFIPLSRSSLWWPASGRCQGLPRRPFLVCNSFCRPAPVLGQYPDRSRAENHSLAPNDVFVSVRVPAQPASVYELCLAFLQMCSRPSCQNQLSKR